MDYIYTEMTGIFHKGATVALFKDRLNSRAYLESLQDLGVDTSEYEVRQVQVRIER